MTEPAEQASTPEAATTGNGAAAATQPTAPDAPGLMAAVATIAAAPTGTSEAGTEATGASHTDDASPPTGAGGDPIEGGGAGGGSPDGGATEPTTRTGAALPPPGLSAPTGALGCDLVSLIHRDDRRAAAECFAEAARRQAPVRFHHRLADASGSPPRWVDHQINPLVSDGSIDGYLGVLIPVPDWVAHGDRTRRIVRLVETTNDLVGEFDLEAKRITYLNPRAIEVFEADERRLERLRLSSLYGPDAEILFRSTIWPALLQDSRWEGELPMTTAAGTTIHVQQWITADRDAERSDRPDRRRRP